MYRPTEPPVTADVERRRAALLDLIAALRAAGYAFVTPTPATHARVLARADAGDTADLRDAFGWNRPFAASLLDPALLRQLLACGVVEPAEAGRFRSRLRVSSLGDRLFVHSGYPTTAQDAVFFGPDSYRFAALITDELAECPRRAGTRLVDIGTGAGVGAIVAARLCPDLSITMTDINPAALDLARINAAAAGVAATFVLAADLAQVPGELDVVLANPPYIIDGTERAYRNGGGMHGAEVALGMAADASARLAPGGRFILYTGSAILRGADPLAARLRALAAAQDCTLAYRELDPDVFGEELDEPAYADVERIALVAAVMRKRG